MTFDLEFALQRILATKNLLLRLVAMMYHMQAIHSLVFLARHRCLRVLQIMKIHQS